MELVCPVFLDSLFHQALPLILARRIYHDFGCGGEVIFFSMWTIQLCEVSFFIASCLESKMISNSLEFLLEMTLLNSTSVDCSIVTWTGRGGGGCRAHVAVELGSVSIILSILF